MTYLPEILVIGGLLILNNLLKQVLNDHYNKKSADLNQEQWKERFRIEMRGESSDVSNR